MTRRDNDSGRAEAKLLDILARLYLELHPGQKHSVTLDSSLERDLGFDSLSRTELLLRVEQSFAVKLPDQALVQVETPRDLLREVLQASPAQGQQSATPALDTQLASVEQLPDQSQTLLQVLEWHLAQHPERPHVYLYESDEQEPLTITYQELHDQAQRLAVGLQTYGIETGQSVALMLPTGREYLFCFFAILMCGAIPVPIYPPVRPSQLEDHLVRHAGILQNAQVRLLITVSQAQLVAGLLKAQVDTLQRAVVCDDLKKAVEHALVQPQIQPGDTAFLQYTSGSTGQPKGVVLSHANLLANIRAMGEANQVDSRDCFVSWLPLYHDMGLIGAWLGSLYYAMPLVLMSPLSFLSHPPRWLWAIHRHKATLSAAPNFAYELCLSKLPDSAFEGLDLSSWRRAFNGAEPVIPQTLERFSQRFASHGFSYQAFAPVYGLAESAVGLAFPPPDRGPMFDRIQREAFQARGEAIIEPDPEQPALEVPACGQPLPGYQFRVVDGAGRELPERQEGQLQFQGPSATSGYFGNPEANQGLFDGDWLNTGDLAYIAQGDLYLTGRNKDLIIRGGRNFYPYEIETAVGDLAGVRKGCVAVFGCRNQDSGKDTSERLIVLAESRVEDQEEKQALIKEIGRITVDLIGLPADEILLVPPHTVLKTSSGKIRRSAMRDLYQQGQLEQRSRAPWLQLLRLELASMKPRIHRFGQWLSRQVYARYAMLIYWLLGPLIWLPTLALPKLEWRWRYACAGARLLFRLTGIRLTVEGLENLPREHLGVIIANHSSYLDGIALMASLPGPFAFVAKQELKQESIGRFLTAIGVQFVERFDTRQSLADAKALEELLEQGRSLMYFPEGTFTRSPGLLPFRMGAFMLAAEQQVPVYPVIIQGTRSILREEERFPRRGAIRIQVAQPISTEQPGWAGAIELRDASRQIILERSGEPDVRRSPFQDVDKT